MKLRTLLAATLIASVLGFAMGKLAAAELHIPSFAHHALAQQAKL